MANVPPDLTVKVVAPLVGLSIAYIGLSVLLIVVLLLDISELFSAVAVVWFIMSVVLALGLAAMIYVSRKKKQE
ncbi:MAG: hypothetical protein ACXQT1_05430 [Methermicoccaceae archaeon]